MGRGQQPDERQGQYVKKHGYETRKGYGEAKTKMNVEQKTQEKEYTKRESRRED